MHTARQPGCTFRGASRRMAAMGLAFAVTILGLGFRAPSPVFAQTSPTAAVRYSLTLDGYEIASFSELAGITTSVDVVGNPSSRPGDRSLTAVLGRPLGPGRELLEWHERILQHPRQPERRHLRLVAYNERGDEVAVFEFVNAWPAKIAVGSLQAGTTEVLMETVTLVCEQIKRVSP